MLFKNNHNLRLKPNQTSGYSPVKEKLFAQASGYSPLILILAIAMAPDRFWTLVLKAGTGRSPLHDATQLEPHQKPRAAHRHADRLKVHGRRVEKELQDLVQHGARAEVVVLHLALSASCDTEPAILCHGGCSPITRRTASA